MPFEEDDAVAQPDSRVLLDDLQQLGCQWEVSVNLVLSLVYGKGLGEVSEVRHRQWLITGYGYKRCYPHSGLAVVLVRKAVLRIMTLKPIVSRLSMSPG